MEDEKSLVTPVICEDVPVCTSGSEAYFHAAELICYSRSLSGARSGGFQRSARVHLRQMPAVFAAGKQI